MNLRLKDQKQQQNYAKMNFETQTYIAQPMDDELGARRGPTFLYLSSLTHTLRYPAGFS